MKAALESVKSGVSVLWAALERGVPRQTLQDRVLSRVPYGILYVKSSKTFHI